MTKWIPIIYRWKAYEQNNNERRMNEHYGYKHEVWCVIIRTTHSNYNVSKEIIIVSDIL